VDAIELLDELTDRGVQLVSGNGRLRFQPKRLVTPELRQALIDHKAELIALLAREKAAVRWRAEAMRPRVPPTGPIPPMYARRLSRVPSNGCLSCGDPLTPGNKYHCEPCVRAAWIVLREVRGWGEQPRRHQNRPLDW
jgi:tubulysin polyketide synthase-like protein